MIDVAIVGAAGYAGAELTRLVPATPQLSLGDGHVGRGRRHARGRRCTRRSPAATSCTSSPTPRRSRRGAARLPGRAAHRRDGDRSRAARRRADRHRPARPTSGSPTRRLYERWYGVPHTARRAARRGGLRAARSWHARTIAGRAARRVSGLLSDGAAARGRSRRRGGRRRVRPGHRRREVGRVRRGARRRRRCTHFVSANEAVSAYKVATHRHTPEIAQELGARRRRARAVDVHAAPRPDDARAARHRLPRDANRGLTTDDARVALSPSATRASRS